MLFLLVMIFCAVTAVVLSWSLISEWESNLNRQRIEVQRNELKRIIAKVTDPETLYYIQDYDVFGI